LKFKFSQKQLSKTISKNNKNNMVKRKIIVDNAVCEAANALIILKTRIEAQPSVFELISIKDAHSRVLGSDRNFAKKVRVFIEEIIDNKVPFNKQTRALYSSAVAMSEGYDYRGRYCDERNCKDLCKVFYKNYCIRLCSKHRNSFKQLKENELIYLKDCRVLRSFSKH
jgi:hypothetical protein